MPISCEFVVWDWWNRNIFILRFCGSGYPTHNTLPPKEHGTTDTLPPRKDTGPKTRKGSGTRDNDIRLWKHYLPATSLAGGKSQNSNIVHVEKHPTESMVHSTRQPSLSYLVDDPVAEQYRATFSVFVEVQGNKSIHAYWYVVVHYKLLE